MTVQEWIEARLSEAPPLTPEQIDIIKTLLSKQGE